MKILSTPEFILVNCINENFESLVENMLVDNEIKDILNYFEDN